MKMGQPLVYKNTNTIMQSNFNSAKKNKMIIHGYGQDGRADFNRNLKNALLNHDDYNVVVVDWSTAAGSSYTTARNNINAIGKSVAQFIDWMKLDEGYLHVIGFDLGAHIAGIAGKNTLNGRIDKITGLDPSKPGFNINQSIGRLASGDARFVEVYHSNGGKLGIMEHVVDADKYINDGKTQNDAGCMTDECSHEYATKIFIDLVNGKKYSSYTCETLQELDGRGCGFLPDEWWGESTGLTQIVTNE